MKISLKPGRIISKLWKHYSASAVFCVVISILATIVDFLWWNETTSALRQTLTNASNAFLFGLVISTAVSTLLNRKKASTLLAWACGIVAAALEYFFPNSDLYGGAALAAVCLCLWAAAGHEKPSLRLNQICGWFFVCLGMSIVIWLALNIIQSAILSLFFPGAASNIRTGFSTLVSYFSFLIFAPWMFLGGLPDESTPDDKRLGFRKFNARVLLPLSLLLMAVLLAYVGKIVLTWTMPVGTMNGYALAALALFTFFHLTLTGEENKIAAFFRKWAGWLMLPILAAQQVGVWIRVSAYGLTYARICGIVFTVLCAAVVVTALLRKRARWFFPAAAIAAVIFIASPLNAGNIARMNQEDRLEAALQRNNMLTEDGAIIPNADADLDDRTIIYDSISYLLQQDAPEDSLTAWLNAYFTKDDGNRIYASADDLYKLLGFARPRKQADSQYNRWHYSGTAQSNELDTRGIAYASWFGASDHFASAEAYQEARAANPDIDQDYFIVDEAALHAAILSVTMDCTLPDIPLTLVIDGDAIPLNPLLTATEITPDYQINLRNFTLENDRIPLSTGQILHIGSLDISAYSSGTVYIHLTGWLLTPETE